jgi:hypothetical protein
MRVVSIFAGIALAFFGCRKTHEAADSVPEKNAVALRVGDGEKTGRVSTNAIGRIDGDLRNTNSSKSEAVQAETIPKEDECCEKRLVVEGSVFTGTGKDGDFGWMISQRKYAKTLFVFNDNEEQFRAFIRGDRLSGCSVGGGNAIVRPYQCQEPPRAQGIPTGTLARGGYRSLDPETRENIDIGIERVKALVKTGDYDRVVFSQERDRPTLGAGIFNPSAEVRDYIYNALIGLNTT